MGAECVEQSPLPQVPETHLSAWWSTRQQMPHLNWLLHHTSLWKRLTVALFTNPFLPALRRSWCWVAWAKQAAPASWQLQQIVSEMLASKKNKQHDIHRKRLKNELREKQLVLLESSDASLPLGQQRIPKSHISAISRMTSCCQQWRASTLNNHNYLTSLSLYQRIKTWKTKSAVFLPCVCIVKKGTAVEAAWKGMFTAVRLLMSI